MYRIDMIIIEVIKLWMLHTQIRINFLPVGHTHEDVDQMFSRIGSKIHRVGADTLKGYYYGNHHSYFIFIHTIQLCSHQILSFIRDCVYYVIIFLQIWCLLLQLAIHQILKQKFYKVWVTTSQSLNIQLDNCTTTPNHSVFDFF